MKLRVAVLLGTIVASCAVFAQPMSPQQLLDRYRNIREASQRQFIQTEVLLESKLVVGDKVIEDEHDIVTFDLKADGNRFDLKKSEHHDQQYDTNEKPVSQGLSRDFHYIWDNERYIQLVKIIPGHPSAFLSSSSGRAQGALSHDYEPVYLDGILKGEGDDRPVDVVLRNASTLSTRPEKENINGSFCYVTDAVTPNGKFTLWIDPEHGYNIAQAEVAMEGSDLYYGAPVGMKLTPPPNRKTEEKWRPETRDSFLFRLYDVEFKQVGDDWVPVVARSEAITTYNSGRRKVIFLCKLRRTHIDLNPDFGAVGAFIPDIPEGTPVAIEEAPGIRYVWKNGKPVARVE